MIKRARARCLISSSWMIGMPVKLCRNPFRLQFESNWVKGASAARGTAQHQFQCCIVECDKGQQKEMLSAGQVSYQVGRPSRSYLMLIRTILRRRIGMVHMHMSFVLSRVTSASRNLTHLPTFLQSSNNSMHSPHLYPLGNSC